MDPDDLPPTHREAAFENAPTCRSRLRRAGRLFKCSASRARLSPGHRVPYVRRNVAQRGSFRHRHGAAMATPCWKRGYPRGPAHIGLTMSGKRPPFLSPEAAAWPKTMRKPAYVGVKDLYDRIRERSVDNDYIYLRSRMQPHRPVSQKNRKTRAAALGSCRPPRHTRSSDARA